MGEKEKKKLEQMRKEYENFSVPQEAKKRMEEGIKMAKKEQEKERFIRFAKGAGIGCAAAMAAIVILANSSQTIALAMEKIPIIGAIAEVVTFRDYKNETNGFEADIEIPKVEIHTKESNEEINQKIEKVNKTIEEYGNELIAEYERELKESEGEGNYSVTSSYEVISDNEKYLSIRINTTLEMASGTEFVKIFNIDKDTGEIMKLKDLFDDTVDYITIISDNIKQQMREQMQADEEIVYFLEGENDFLEEDDIFNKITGEESFYFNQSGELVIVFDEYEVAPGYMGAVEFTIPSSVITPKK